MQAELQNEEVNGVSSTDFELFTDEPELKPPGIVAELDKYVISQQEAKRAVAIALRNRWRRMKVKGDLAEEITPKNIIMIGPTGVGKTEISRRLAKLVKAPFIKVEASKFTEVGYIGRDVESIIRDLIEVAHSLVKEEELEKVRRLAEELAEERILDLLLPGSDDDEEQGTTSTTREKLGRLLREGKLEERMVEIEVQQKVSTHLEIMGPPGFGEVEGQLKDMLSNMVPKARQRKTLKVAEARKVLIGESQEEIVDHDEISRLAIRRCEQSGIVFIDEIDKICLSEAKTKGPDVSREGVQRDLLPLVEGCTVSTKYGAVRTDHILFIASGAFHLSKPSDLMPEFQGRFPIRVELRSLSAEDFVRILQEPKNALSRQYTALLATENVELVFADSGIDEIARLTAEVNSKTEDIGARRLHTLLEKLLEELSFEADRFSGQKVEVNQEYVRERLSDIVQDADLSRFIL